MNDKETLAAWTNLFLYLSKEMKSHLSSLQISLCTTETVSNIVKHLTEIIQICCDSLFQNNISIKSINLTTPQNQIFEIKLSLIENFIISTLPFVNDQIALVKREFLESSHNIKDSFNLDITNNDKIHFDMPNNSNLFTDFWEDNKSGKPFNQVNSVDGYSTDDNNTYNNITDSNLHNNSSINNISFKINKFKVSNNILYKQKYKNTVNRKKIKNSLVNRKSKTNHTSLIPRANSNNTFDNEINSYNIKINEKINIKKLNKTSKILTNDPPRFYENNDNNSNTRDIINEFNLENKVDSLLYGSDDISKPYDNDNIDQNSSSENLTDWKSLDVESLTHCTNHNGPFKIINNTNSVTPKRGRKPLSDQSEDNLFKEFRCIFCYQLYSDFNSMMNHFLNEHSIINEEGESEVCCLMCPLKWPGKTIKRNKLLAILHHLHCKHEYKVPEFITPYRCDQPNCSYLCFRRDVFLHHSYSHDKAHYSATCDLCGITVNKARLTEHQKMCPENKDRVKKFACHLCDRSYYQKTALRMHIAVQHDKVKNFLCTICTQTMATRTSFFTHMYDLHGVNIFNKPILSCDLCSQFSCLRKYQLVNHKLRIHSDAKVYQCDVCMKCYKFPAELKSHKVSHGEKSFSCSQCSFKTVREKDLKVHVIAQHTDQRYSCEICGYTSGYKENVLKHKRLSHKIVFNRHYRGKKKDKIVVGVMPTYDEI